MGDPDLPVDTHYKRPLYVLKVTKNLCVAIVLTLSSCNQNDNSLNQLVMGGVTGDVTGAATGNAIWKYRQSTVIGGEIGTVVGGAITMNIAQYERELKQQVAGTGAVVSNNSNQLRVILPESITFTRGSSTVVSRFLPALRGIAYWLHTHPSSTVSVLGHTDNVGSSTYNRRLSQHRASAIARILLINGVSSSRISYAGRGHDAPITMDASATSRKQNRRVEIIITP